LFNLLYALDLIGEIIGYAYWAYNQFVAGLPINVPF